MVAFLVTVHVFVSLFLIFVILLQPGKGEGMGGAFGGGGGGSGSVFGGRGSVTFLAKVTEVCAVIFMVTSLTLAYRSSHSDSVLRARRNLATQDATKDTKADASKVPATDSTKATPDTTPASGPSTPSPAPNAAPASGNKPVAKPK